jgi:hypothetical protein
LLCILLLLWCWCLQLMYHGPQHTPHGREATSTTSPPMSRVPCRGAVIVVHSVLLLWLWCLLATDAPRPTTHATRTQSYIHDFAAVTCSLLCAVIVVHSVLLLLQVLLLLCILLLLWWWCLHLTYPGPQHTPHGREATSTTSPPMSRVPCRGAPRSPQARRWLSSSRQLSCRTRR